MTAAVLDAVNCFGGINVVGLSVRATALGPGSYTVKATYFGLYAEQKITVEPGALVQVALQLKLPDLKAPPKS